MRSVWVDVQGREMVFSVLTARQAQSMEKITRLLIFIRRLGIDLKTFVLQAFWNRCARVEFLKRPNLQEHLTRQARFLIFGVRP